MLTASTLPTLAFGPIGYWELLALALLGLLIFGKRLPEVGRSIGRGIVEFKRGLSGIEDDVNNAGAPRLEKNEKEELDTGQAATADEPRATGSS